MSRSHLSVLDGLRGVAALSVLLFHAAHPYVPSIFPRGGLAVDFFFLLSGFVISYAYEGRIYAGMSLRKFMMARLIRLLPLLWIGALIGAVGFRSSYDAVTLLAVFTAGILLIPTPLASAGMFDVAFPVNPPEWSLFYELYGNAFYALIFNKLSSLVLAFLIIAFGIVLTGQAYAHEGISEGPFWPGFLGGVPRFGFSFFSGVAIYRAYKRGYLSKFRCPAPVLFLALILILELPDGIANDGIIDLSIVLVLFPILVASGAVSNGFGMGCRIFGDLSYPVYVLQGGIIAYMHWPFTRFHLSQAGALTLLTVMIISYGAVCWAILRYIDMPVRGWLSARVKRESLYGEPRTAPHV